jgi:hypothetical protein
MSDGLQDIIVSTGAGIVVGALTGIVLARGGASGARRIMTGLGGGVGLGASWTKVSMQLEELLQDDK